MASIVDRGTRSAPKFFAKYDFVDASGERKQRWKLLAGVQTKKQATQELARVEREVAAGRDPFPERLARSGRSSTSGGRASRTATLTTIARGPNGSSYPDSGS